MSILDYFGSGAIQHLDSIAPQKRSRLWYQTMDLEDYLTKDQDWYNTVRNLLTDFDLIATTGIEVGINFTPQLANRFTPEMLTLIFMNTLDEFISKLRKPDTIHYIFVGEFSEVGKFHFHGAVSGLTYYQRNKLNRIMRDRLGLPDIKAIKDVRAYSTYALKQYLQRNNVLQKYIEFIRDDKFYEGMVWQLDPEVADNIAFIISSE